MRWATSIAAALSVFAAGNASAGDLVGTVRYAGAAPEPISVETTKDRAVCGERVEDESLVVTEGRVANAVLVVKATPVRAMTRIALDQERCRYRPHVQAAPIGSTLEVTNGDPLLHSVHGWAGHVTRFDLVTPSKGTVLRTRLDRPGVIQVRCDVHSWMTAYVVVADGPAAVTGRDGAFTIPDLPEGKYVVTAWHERLGEKSAEVIVPARGEVRFDVTYGP